MKCSMEFVQFKTMFHHTAIKHNTMRCHILKYKSYLILQVRSFCSCGMVYIAHKPVRTHVTQIDNISYKICITFPFPTHHTILLITFSNISQSMLYVLTFILRTTRRTQTRCPKNRDFNVQCVMLFVINVI